MKYIVFILSFLFVSGCATTPLKCLNVGTTGDYPPFSYLLENGKYSGFDVDLSKLFAQSIGKKACFVKTSWPTLMKDYSDNKFEIALSGISITKEREKVAHLSSGHVLLGKALLYRCSDKRFSKKSNFDQKKFVAVVNPGGTNELYLRKHFKNVSITVYKDNNSIFEKIRNHSADFMITDSVEASYQVNKDSKLCRSTGFLKESKAYIGALTQSQLLKENFNNFIYKILRNGQLQILKNRYLSK